MLILAVVVNAGLWSTDAGAIVRRHDVPDESYRVSRNALPPLVDLPHEGHGALIAPRWVVTAAHAVAYMKDHREDWYVDIEGKRYAVAKFVIYPGFEEGVPAWKQMFDKMKEEPVTQWKADYDRAMAKTHDIALLQLVDSVQGVHPLERFRGNDELGRVVQIYGAGASGTDQTGAPTDAPHRGELRRAENRITEASGPWLRYKFNCDANALPLEGVIAGGDSGGPVLIQHDGRWMLAGLTHGLDGSIDDVQHTRKGDFKLGVCGQTFASTRLSYFSRWIDSVTKEP